MTRDEALAYGNRVIDLGLNDETQAFCEMAVKALQQEPCEDAISRQAVLDMVEDITDQFGNKHRVVTEGMISLLPPVTPKPKTGHWIRFKEFENGYYHIKCSECGQYWSIDGCAKTFKYCFNCGAKMESEG